MIRGEGDKACGRDGVDCIEEGRVGWELVCNWKGNIISWGNDMI